MVQSFGKIKGEFKKIKKNTWLLLLAIFILAIILRISLSPMHDTDQSLGHEYLLSAKAFLYQQRYVNCARGTFNDCLFEKMPQHPGGYPLLLSGFSLLFGTSIKTAIGFNILFSSLTLIVVFLIGQLIFKNKTVALLAALTLAVLKSHIFFAGTANATSINLFFITI